MVLRRPWSGYAVALILALGTSLAMRGLVAAVPDFRYLSVLYIPAVILVAFTWGVGPGACCALTGALGLELLVLVDDVPAAQWQGGSLLGLLVLMLMGLGISILTSQAESGRRQALALAAALQASEREAGERAGELEATFEAMADAVAVFNQDGQIASLNTAARELLQPEGAGLPPVLLPRDTHGVLLPEDAWPQRRVLQGEVLTGARTVDIMIRRPDGTYMHANVSGTPTRDGTGQVRGAVLVVRDVTARRSLERRAVEALEALLSMAQALVDKDLLGSSGQAGARTVGQRMAELTRSVLGCERVSIVSIDPARRTVEPAGVVGLSPEEERHWWDMLSGLDVAEYLSADLARRLEEENTLTVAPRYEPVQSPMSRFVLVTRLHIGSGTVGFLTLGQRQPFDADAISLVSGVAHLITLVLEREHLLREAAEAHGAELALREANRRMDEFLGIASHELRTPLTSMRGFVQLTGQRLARLVDQDGQSYPDLAERLQAARDLLARAERQFLRLERLITDLLDATRAQAGRLDMQVTPVDLKALVLEMVQEQRLTAPARSIQLASMPDDAVWVRGDPDRLGQVVTNFLTNANRYSPQDRPVEVTLTVEAGRARVQVRDEGPGIVPSEQDRIWERFYQIPSSQSVGHPTGGLGLGLHISRTIVEKHGGEIGLSSQPGHGATFWFSLPLAPQ